MTRNADDKEREAAGLEHADAAVLDEMTRRVEDIDNSYRAMAEKVGQLYMRADEHHLGAITRHLDKPMRNASDNERMFAGLLEDLRMLRARRP
ncbi:MAG: hypothetical protein HC793_04255 [Aquincola sp.]|nr:hypothetical protein [Aquincola sp.]